MDTKDGEVTSLHMIFDLNGVLVGKEYFRNNHLMSPSFNLARSYLITRQECCT
jgi:hypothetical protein